MATSLASAPAGGRGEPGPERRRTCTSRSTTAWWTGCPRRAEEESNSGARPLRRAIQRHIEDELSEFLIRQEVPPERIEFTMNGDQVVLIAMPKEDLIAN